MSEMVERIAKAIAEHGGSNWEACLKAPGLRMAGMYRAMARTAVEAVREPTEDMKSVEGVHWGYGCHVCGGLAEGWQSMIDAALKD